MNCRRYRACLVGIIAIALISCIFICIKYSAQNQIPADGVLVKMIPEDQDGGVGAFADASIEIQIYMYGMDVIWV